MSEGRCKEQIFQNYSHLGEERERKEDWKFDPEYLPEESVKVVLKGK